MKKPDYCPEWFDIDLYDNLIDQSRYALSMGFWNRKLNYKRFLEINGEIKTLEERKEYARDLLKAMMRLMEFFDNPTKDNYNPVQEAQGAIVELQLSDVADLFSECYLNHPQMREFFQLATTFLTKQWNTSIQNKWKNGRLMQNIHLLNRNWHIRRYQMFQTLRALSLLTFQIAMKS